MNTSPQTDLSELCRAWRPGPVTVHDGVPAAPVAALSALLDLPEPVACSGDPLPPAWHWLYFLDWPAQRDLGPDGHPSCGHFLPPIPDRMRMAAGGRLHLSRPLHVGVPAQRTSRLGSVSLKHGKSGAMVFVTVRHEIWQGSRACLIEEQEMVYRQGRNTGRAGQCLPTVREAPNPDADWQLAVRSNSALLFRFSALTANAHRIHYDAPYAKSVEGYPGPVVHGPLLVLLMLELARRNVPGRRVRSVSYRLRRPSFAGEHIRAVGNPVAAGRAHLSIVSAREPQHATAELAFL